MEYVGSSAENRSDSHFLQEDTNHQPIKPKRRVFLRGLLAAKGCHAELRCSQSAPFWQQPPKPGNPASGVLRQAKCCTTHCKNITAPKQYMLGFGFSARVIINLEVQSRTCYSTSLQLEPSIFRET